ncbi:hypothetical protein OI774_003698 [Salmonella enterica]|nr:hypothetical protein [Salmonella enterica]EKA2542044.1 hypothetical protein [Salmonella enterica]
MSVMTTSETPVSTVTEPEVFRRTRNRFNQWLQTEFDRHYHTMRDGGCLFVDAAAGPSAKGGIFK